MGTVIVLLGLVVWGTAPQEGNAPDAALFVAAQSGQAARVADLLEAGADPNASDARGVTPLMLAAGRPATGPGSGTGGGRGGRGLSAAPAQREVVRLLAEAGVDVNAQTTNGTTALMVAVLAGQTGVVQDLLEAGADPNARNSAGATPLRLAMTTGNSDARDRLVLAGAQREDEAPLSAEAVTSIRSLLPFPAPANASRPPVRLNFGSGPERIFYVGPEYPIAARRDRIGGVVVLEATIDTDGTVAGIRVISGPEPLRQASIDAVAQWRYAPYIVDGEPVSWTTTAAVTFQLR